jgi:hypothetical protein
LCTLSPEQVTRKTKLLSKFVTDNWGSSSPTLYETISQEALEAYEALIDSYIRTDLPVPEYALAPPCAAAEGQKVCRSCRHSKVLSDYYSHPRTKDRKQPICKTCQKARVGAQRLKTKEVDQIPMPQCF